MDPESNEPAIEAVIFDIGDVLEVNPRTGWARRWATRLSMDVADVQANVDGARAVGMAGVTFVTNAQATSELNALLMD